MRQNDREEESIRVACNDRRKVERRIRMEGKR